MPKPLLLQRPSGLYARFFVPVDLQARWGSRYIVRSLCGERADRARLLAARIGYALAQAFEQARNTPMAAPKDLLKTAIAAAQSGKDWRLRFPDGMEIEANGAEDHARALEALAAAKPLFASTAPTLPAGMLSARIETFLSQFKSKGRSATNLLDTTFTLGLFLSLVGDKELAAVDSSDLDKFVAALEIWPSNASKKALFRGLTAPEIVAKATALPDVPRLAVRTKEKHLDRLRVFFGYCIKRKFLRDNPADGLGFTSKSQDGEQTRQPFNTEDLRQLFDRAHNTARATQPHKHWGPELGLYTGARVNEIAQLLVTDVEKIEGIWGLHLVGLAAARKRVKNTASRRFLPLHPLLIEAGFLDYVEDVKAAGFPHVFPGLPWGVNGPGDAVSDWFNRTYRKACGITDPAKTFHSFRHTFASLAERSSLTEQRIARLTGHKGDKSVLRSHYIKPATLAEREADLKKIKFPKLPEIPVYKRGHFKPWFHRVKVLAARKARQDAEATKSS